MIRGATHEPRVDAPRIHVDRELEIDESQMTVRRYQEV